MIVLYSIVYIKMLFKFTDNAKPTINYMTFSISLAF